MCIRASARLAGLLLQRLPVGNAPRTKANVEVSCGIKRNDCASRVCKSKNNNRLYETRKVKKWIPERANPVARFAVAWKALEVKWGHSYCMARHGLLSPIRGWVPQSWAWLA